MIRLINGDAKEHGARFDMIFTDPPFDMSGQELLEVLDCYEYDHLVLIASLHQIIDFAKNVDMDFGFDLVVSHVTPKKSKSYAQPNYLHSNVAYFKQKGVRSAFDRRRIERQDHYSDKATHYYPTIFHAPKNNLQYKYQKNQAMIDDLLGAFKVKTVCDMFAGSGTTGVAAITHDMDCTLIEQDADAFEIMQKTFRLLGAIK